MQEISNSLPASQNQSAVRLDHRIVLIDIAPENEDKIWTYNIYTEVWRKHIIPRGKRVPFTMGNTCGVVIRGEIHFYSMSLQKLTYDESDCFAWKQIKEKGKVPSPRLGHTAWAYKGNLWVFGGFGDRLDWCLHDHGEFAGFYNNQLLQFSTVSEEWANEKCHGELPKHRCDHSTTVVGDNVWLFGGDSNGAPSGELYRLNMCTFTWTRIQIRHARPPGRHLSSLNAITDSQLVLHAGISPVWAENFSDTWIFDLQSKSWKQYTLSKDNPRYRHTGLPGFNSEIIIFGGDGSNNKPRTDTFHILLAPKSLQQLAMKIVHMHRAGLPWKSLPKKLIKHINLRAEDNTHQN